MATIKNTAQKVLFSADGSMKYTLEAAVKADADLTGANLTGANLADADLTGANLAGAYLAGANLAGADLGGAKLRDAKLRDAYLAGANLAGAYLAGADLRDADLTDANLGGANLAGADLRGANLLDAKLGGADLRGAKGLPKAPIVEDLDQKMLEATSIPGALNMEKWHCGTSHCRAGWAVTLAGAAGAELERKTSTLLAGILIYKASTGRDTAPNFFAGNVEALADIVACAARK